MAREKNVMLTALLQSFEATVLIYLLLVPQFLFVAISRYFATLIEDAKISIQDIKFTCNAKLMENFAKVINLHARSLG